MASVLRVTDCNIAEWNNTKCKNETDIESVARSGDMVFSVGGYLFLLQGVGEVNNFCVQKIENYKGARLSVIESVKMVLERMIECGITSVMFLTGREHKSYDILYRYFNAEQITRIDIGYIVWLLKETH